jgi:hypothetical protein
MSGILLDRSEFLALMDAAQANGVVGVEMENIAPADVEEHKALVLEGLKRLEDRGLLRMVDDVNVIDVDLVSMAVLIAHPETAVITSREEPEAGQQLFMHYLAGDVVMEQTRPDEQTFRWALVPNRTELVERILGILPIQEEPSSTTVQGTIDQEEFVDFRVVVESGDHDAARAQLALHGITGDSAEVVIATVDNPEFAGTVAVLRCENDEVVDARNLLVLQGDEDVLLLKQVVPGEPTLEIKSIDVSALRDQLSNWIYEFSNQEAVQG